jgi:hypothetical protein
MTAGLDCPEMVFFTVLLGSRSFGRARTPIILFIGRVSELVVAASANDNHFLIRVLINARITSEAWPGGRRRLEVRLGWGLPATKPVGLVVECGLVARKGIRIHGELVGTNDLYFSVVMGTNSSSNEARKEVSDPAKVTESSKCRHIVAADTNDFDASAVIAAGGRNGGR